MDFVNVAINNACNFRCKHCDIGQRTDAGIWHNYHRARQQPATYWLDLFDKLKPATVHINGVEPLMYKEFGQLLLGLKKRNIKSMLTTNGWLWKSWSSVLTEVNDLAVSVDGWQETHDTIRGAPGAFNRVIELVDFLEKNNRIPHTRISFAITPDT